MPVLIDGKTFYRTHEVCSMVGISRTTFFRWIREGTVADAKTIDRRGWRLFDDEDLSKLKTEANQVRPNTARALEKEQKTRGKSEN